MKSLTGTFKQQASGRQASGNFHRTTYPVMLTLLVGSIISAGITLSLIIYLIFFPWKSDYYILLHNQSSKKITALDYPIVSRFEILRWASQAVISIYNFDFSNWEVRLKVVAPLFTKNGFSRFQDALKLDGVLTGIIDQKLQMTSVVTGPPVILAEGNIGSRYTWKVNIPVLLTYTSSSDVRQRNIVITMVIARIPVVHAPRGYAIEQFYEESA